MRGWLIVLALALLAYAGYALYSQQRLHPQGAGVFAPVVPSCVVGFSGTNASVAIKGWGATEACARWVSQNTNAYSRTEPPTESVLCEYDAGGLHYVVRDAGTLKLVGNKLCSEIRKMRR